MKKVKDGNVVAFDVDDTLVMWDASLLGTIDEYVNIGGETCAVNTHTVEYLKKLKARYYSIVVWSAGGSDWAEDVVYALELEDYVDVIMPKLDQHVDDCKDPSDKLGKWRYITLDGTKLKE